MSAPSRKRSRPREFKFGGAAAQQVARQRTNAAVAQFRSLPTELRPGVLATIHGLCGADERRKFLKLHFDAELAKVGAGDAQHAARKRLAQECLQMLWGGDAAAMHSALGELRSAAPLAAGGAAAAAAAPAPAAAPPMPAAPAVTIETQTPTGLPQLLLVEELSSLPPAVSTVGTDAAGWADDAAAANVATAESHTQTVRNPCVMLPWPCFDAHWLHVRSWRPRHRWRRSSRPSRSMALTKARTSRTTTRGGATRRRATTSASARLLCASAPVDRHLEFRASSPCTREARV